ncbi:hypothetical protein WMY93_014661 [Mugilogobius chulae]|uniref:ubiquitinyl hydrolase 1 n=1 Tax=Mugilogobius chulae TaxID=88201 RepID=A0AAW0NVK1_9GOBI
MDSGGNMRSIEERGAERHMDDYLKSIGLQRKKIAKDGSCLFRAVAEQVLHCQSLHSQVRSKCVEFLRKNRKSYEAFIEGDFVDYLHKLQDPQQWVGEVEINALAIMYKRDFWIFQEPGKAAVNITANNFKDKVQLCFLNGNHYDSVYPLSRVRNSAMCQSILYELLYGKVFAVDQNQLGVCQRATKTSDQLIDDSMAPARAGRGRGRLLSERVKRSLNPTLLRNVQYDVWHRSKKAQQKMDFCIASGMQYSVGDRCQVRVEASGEIVPATVKKLSPDNSSPVTVYNDDLGEIKVPVWKLRPPAETTWSTVVREKRVPNGAADWGHRGRGKPASVPSSVSQKTALPAGRGAKSQTWPQQPFVEEREAPSSKSESVLFGLTEEQRLAKEEEERNAALVELQFPDDKSFPALGTQSVGQSDGGKKKGADKKRSQKNTTRKSSVEDVHCVSPSSGDRPKSSSPPLPSSVSPPVSASTAPKINSCSTIAPAPKTSQSGMIPSSASHFSFVTPVLPAASNSSASSSLPPSLIPKALSSSPPTFIAPIAPPPTAAQTLIGRTTPSPPSAVATVTHNPPVLTETKVQVSNVTSNFQTPTHTEVSEPQVAASANQLPQNNAHNQIQDERTFQTSAPVQVQLATAPKNSQMPSPPSPSCIPLPPTSFQTSYPPSLPQIEASIPADIPQQAILPPSASQPQTEHQTSNSHLDQAPPPAAQPPQQHYMPQAIPLQQHLAQYYQDPLYPGFPQGAEGQVVPPPPMSVSQSGDDLPQDKNILRFFFNLGIKAYNFPMYAPFMYLLPLQQAHTMQPRALSRSPSPVCPPQEPYQTYNPTPPPPQAPQAQFHPGQSTPPRHPAYNPAHSHAETTHSMFNHNTFDHSNQHQSSYNPPPEHFHPSQEPAPPSEPAYPQSYAPTQHLQWQHANQAYPVNYQYNQGYFQNHSNQGPVEHPQPANGDTEQGLRVARLPGALEGSASANLANMGLNGGHTSMQPRVTSFGDSNHDVGENMMLLVDPPLDKPIVINVPKSGSGPGSPALYSPASHSSDSNCAPFYMTHHHKPSNHNSMPYLSANHNTVATYMSANHSSAAAFLQAAESMSVSVGTEDWDEPEQPRVQYRGSRRGFRGRGRGQYRARGYNNNNNQKYSQRGGRGHF